MNRLIIKNCNEVELDIPQKYALKLYEHFSVRHPNAFYLRRTVKNWDGKVHFISKYGRFKIGLLSRVYNVLTQEYNLDVEIVDTRKPVEMPSKLPKHIGKYKLRPEQIQALESIVYHKEGNIPFHIGVIDATVNFGKSLLMASLFYSFKKKLRTLLITNDADWFNQSKGEFLDYVPDESVTFIQGSKVDHWTSFNIGMVQSLARNIKLYQSELSKIDMVLVDEADLAGNKTYQSVITHLYNSRVRIGLSGTIYMSKLKKDLLKNMNLESFFGPKIYEFRLKDSIDKGYSTNTIVKLVPTPYTYESSIYTEEYENTISTKSENWVLILNRLKYNLSWGRIPALVVCKFIKHCEGLYKYLKEKLPNLNIQFVHVNTPSLKRNCIMKEFREGSIDILISTTIISRGKNFPKLKYMINASGINSQEKTIQFLGRLVRTYKGKSRVYLDDIQYQGNYLSRHSKRRARYYRSEHLKVIDLSKSFKFKTKWLKRKPNR